jgi:hypothetical protein
MRILKRYNRKFSAMVALGAVFAPALGQNPIPRPQDTIGATHGQIAAVIAGIAGGGLALGIGITLAVKHEGHALTGCARSGPDGMTLTSDSDKQTYALLGEVAGIKPGERVRVSGKKGKGKTAGTREFLVEKVSKDFGACDVATH